VGFVTGVARLWQVYLLAGLLGVTAAVDLPAQQVFVSEMVGIEDLPNAVGLNNAAFHAGRLLGPGLAGLLIQWFGTGPVFGLNAVTFGVMALALRRMRVTDLHAVTSRGRGNGSLRDGLVYVRRRPELVLVMTIVGLVSTFGLNFQLTTALMARLVFGKGSGQYGLLGSILAVGSLAGALLAARRNSEPVGRSSSAVGFHRDGTRRRGLARPDRGARPGAPAGPSSRRGRRADLDRASKRGKLVVPARLSYYSRRA